MATLTGQTISSTYKSLLKATSAVPALSSGSSSTERLVFGEDDNADVRTAIYVSQDKVGIGTATPAYGGLQVTQAANNDESGIAVANSGGGRTMRLYCDGSDVAKINAGNGGGQTLVLNEGDGKVSIGDDAPEGWLTINQGSDDDEIISCKSSDVSHSWTDISEADTFFRVKKAHATAGGVILGSFVATGVNFSTIYACYGTDETAVRNAGAGGLFDLRCGKADSASVGTMAADKNMIVFRNHNTTRFIFDTDGELHSDDVIGGGNDWDEWSDLQMASDLSRLPKAKFNEMMKYSAKDFEKAGLLTLSTDEEGNDHAFIKHKAMLMFSMCCFGETYNRISALEKQNKFLEEKLREHKLLN